MHFAHDTRECRNELERQAVGGEIERERLSQQSRSGYAGQREIERQVGGHRGHRRAALMEQVEMRAERSVRVTEGTMQLGNGVALVDAIHDA